MHDASPIERKAARMRDAVGRIDAGPPATGSPAPITVLYRFAFK